MEWPAIRQHEGGGNGGGRREDDLSKNEREIAILLLIIDQLIISRVKKFPEYDNVAVIWHNIVATRGSYFGQQNKFDFVSVFDTSSIYH